MHLSKMLSLFLAAGSFAVLSVGCASQTDDSTESQDKVIGAPEATAAQAVDAFLADEKVRAQLAGHQLSAPEAAVSGFDAIGRANEYVVATFYYTAPAGVLNATRSETVAATVRFEDGPFQPPVVSLVDVKPAEAQGRASALSLEASEEAAVQAFLADSVVKARFGKEVPRAPEAIHIARRTSFGTSVNQYLVISHVTLGDDPAPDGLPKGGPAPLNLRVAATVVFPAVGDHPLVTLATFEKVGQNLPENARSWVDCRSDAGPGAIVTWEPAWEVDGVFLEGVFVMSYRAREQIYHIVVSKVHTSIGVSYSAPNVLLDIVPPGSTTPATSDPYPLKATMVLGDSAPIEMECRGGNVFM